MIKAIALRIIQKPKKTTVIVFLVILDTGLHDLIGLDKATG